jgi:hypothetical protein
MAGNPTLTVLLPAMLGAETVVPAIDAWRAQSALGRLEVLVLLPGQACDAGELPAALGGPVAPVWVGDASLHEARAIGVAGARGDYVFFAEDHCLPDADWAAAMLSRLDEGWDVITPSFRPGSRTLWGLGSFLLAYGEWMPPVRSGPLSIVCGANQCIRTALLRAAGDALPADLQFGAFLARKLVRQQRRCVLAGEAQMRHFDNTCGSQSLREMLYVGMAFGAFRSELWAWPARAAYSLAWPVLACLHGKRAVVQYLRAGRAQGIPVTVFLAVACQTLAWASGESIGVWIGRRRAIPFLVIAEVKPVTRSAVAESDALEAGR